MIERRIMPRNIAPRKNVVTTYYKPENDASSSIPLNTHFFNKNINNITLVKSSVYDKKDLITTFRVWPSLDQDDPTKLVASGLDDLGYKKVLRGLSLSEAVYVASYAGIKVDQEVKSLFPKHVKLGATSFIYCREKEAGVEGIPFWDLPYVTFFLTCNAACKGKEVGFKLRWDPAWSRLFTYDKKKKIREAIPRLSQEHFAIVSLYENGKDFNLTTLRESKYNKDTKAYEDVFVDRHGIPYGENPDDNLIVLRMSASTGRDLLKLVEYGVGKDKDKNFPYGDPIGVYDEARQEVTGGLFFNMYDGRHTKFKGPNTAKEEYKEDEIAGYSVGLSKQVNGPNGPIKPSLNKDQVQNILDKNLFMWAEPGNEQRDDYLLREASIEEQCELMAHAYYPAGKLINFGWSKHPEYLQFDSVQAVINNRRNFVLVQLPMDAANPLLVGDLISAQEEQEEYQAQPKPVKAKAKVIVDDDSLEEEKPILKPKKRVQSKPAWEEQEEVIAFDSSTTDEWDSDFDITPAPTSKAVAKSPSVDDLLDEEDDEEDDFDLDSDDELDLEDDDDDFEDAEDEADFENSAKELAKAKLNASLAKAKSIDSTPKKKR